jgi:HK97 family phage prohead protease
MSNEREARSFSIRAVSKAGKRSLVGRAAAFNTFSHDLGGFREIIKRGCFTNALTRKDEVYFCVNHNPDSIMSRTRNGSLRLRQSDQGLDFETDLPDTQAGKDLWTLISNGTISECSFAFTTTKDSWPTAPEVSSLYGLETLDKLPVRVLEDVRLFDVSSVVSPAYPGSTNVSADDDSEESSVDPAATRPHWEGSSIPASVLAEARARGGDSIEAMRARAKAIGESIRRDDEAALPSPEVIRARAKFWGEYIKNDDLTAAVGEAANKFKETTNAN